MAHERQTEDWQQLKSIVADALDLPPARRDRFVSARCGDDEELLSRVRSIIAAATSRDDVLDGPALRHHVITLLANNDETEEKGRPKEFSLGTPAKLLQRLIEEDVPPAARVGPYRLVHELGRGGMGVVYLAERDDGQFEHRVAVKVLKRGMDTEEVVSRFQNERRILASLEHPNIARLFDGGMTADGMPYFTMEYVEGCPITDYCDERGLGIDERLRLFSQACDAVYYAHQRFVVHRDLKPSNLFVTDSGQVVLLDFGISKLLEDDEHDRTTTVTRRLTPAYAAPEQVLGGPVTIATDIYSLGVILHELLTGYLPRPRQSNNAPPSNVTLVSHEPELPSRIVAIERLKAALLAGGGTADLRRKIRGELDTIVVKALAPVPANRYRNAWALSYDVSAYLENRPIKARRPSLAYRARKYVQRNRALVALFSLAVLLGMAGVSGYLIQTDRIERVRTLYGWFKPLRSPVLVPEGFSVSVFCEEIVGPDGIVVLSDDELLVANEWPGATAGVYRVERGTRWSPETRLDHEGRVSGPEDMIMTSDGMIYVADSDGRVVIRLPVDGGPSFGFVHGGTTGSDNFNPYGLAIAPEGFDGPNVDPGDLIVGDNGYGLSPALWAINRSTGLAKKITAGDILELVFSPDGTLFVGSNCCPSKIDIVTPDGGIVPFLRELPEGVEMAIHPVTNQLYFTVTEGEIHRISPEGGTPELFAENVGGYQDMEFNASGTTLFISATERMQIIEITAAIEAW